MADPAQLDIIADRRVDYIEKFSFLDVDWTGSSLKMQVRAVKDTTGTSLLTILDRTTTDGEFDILYAGTATVASHISAGRLTSEIYGLINPATGVKYASTDSVLLTQISLQILTAALSTPGLFPQETGDDWRGYYDVIRAAVAGGHEIDMRGAFTVRAGVTIP